MSKQITTKSGETYDVVEPTGFAVGKDATASAIKGPTHYCEWETGPSGHVFCRICGVARQPDPVIALLQQIEQNTRRDDSDLVKTLQNRIARLVDALRDRDMSDSAIRKVMDGEA